MPAAPLVFCCRFLILVLRSLPQRRDAVAAGKEQISGFASQKRKFYPFAAPNYPGARHHGSWQL
jgi:hypothetical protein